MIINSFAGNLVLIVFHSIDKILSDNASGRSINSMVSYALTNLSIPTWDGTFYGKITDDQVAFVYENNNGIMTYVLLLAGSYYPICLANNKNVLVQIINIIAPYFGVGSLGTHQIRWDCEKPYITRPKLKKKAKSPNLQPARISQPCPKARRIMIRLPAVHVDFLSDKECVIAREQVLKIIAFEIIMQLKVSDKYIIVSDGVPYPFRCFYGNGEVSEVFADKWIVNEDIDRIIKSIIRRSRILNDHVLRNELRDKILKIGKEWHQYFSNMFSEVSSY